MNAIFHHDRERYVPPSMKGAVVTSSLFHVVLFILTAIGIPFIAKDPLIITTPINVEIIKIDEITQTDIIAKPNKTPEKLEKPKPLENKPKPPKVMAKTPPNLTKPKPPEIKRITEKPVKKPKPKKPKEKPKEKSTTIKKHENDFASLLKNLTPDTQLEFNDDKENILQNSQIARLSDRLTVSELDAFKHQIEPCWNVPSGAKYAEDLAVEIRVLMNPDMTLNSASILNRGRYNRDTHFRAAADSALRALRNPRCSPLKLPADKYEQWKTITIRFDPKDML
ncbi:MAG: cell envelope integrity protein TolA [Alphaproteobacteria bacterium]|nr:cell envelope integrity protein TolA [Alphaproteobacteria bacterium]